MHITGPMDVSMQPDPQSPVGYSRMILTKHYHGGLEAEAQGEMLAGGDYKTGNAGYVAMERISGTLEGHAGTFQVMQMGVVEGGKPELRATVVPGSGTGALQGITGTLRIENSGGKHTYVLEYTLPGA